MANQKTVHKERLGRIVASVFENTSENGTFHNVTFQRIYKAGDDWKSSSSFNRNDLLNLAKLADIVDIWMLNQRVAQTANAF